MGRKLDALLGRNFKTSKCKTIAKLAISRIAILKNQRKVRYSHATSDVIELLQLGRHESALLRVEHVIKEKKMMEAFAIVEDYCQLLTEKVMLIQKNKECPYELKEAISSLIFAASRCGEFPELQELRGIFVTRFGNEFAARSVESRNNNNGVNPKIIEKLSARQPSLESRLKLLKEIAYENGLELHFEEEDVPVVAEEKSDANTKQNSQESYESAKFDEIEDRKDTNESTEDSRLTDENLSESINAGNKYKNVASAAQAAFESAAYAAAAARAAVKLSRTDSQENDDDDDDGDDRVFINQVTSEALKVHLVDHNISSESEVEDVPKSKGRLHVEAYQAAKLDRTLSTSNSDSESLDEPEKQLSFAEVEDDQDNIESSPKFCRDIEFYGEQSEEQTHRSRLLERKYLSVRTRRAKGD